MATKPRYRAIPVNEPDGEGTGWDECSVEEASGFAVEDNCPFDYWLIDGLFDTLGAAEAEAVRLNLQEEASDA